MFLSFSTLAQMFALDGTIQNLDKITVPFASVALSNNADTSTIQFSISKEDGSFRLKNISQANILLL